MSISGSCTTTQTTTLESGQVQSTNQQNKDQQGNGLSKDVASQ